MLNTAFVFLISTVLDLITIAFLLRFYLQWVQAPHRNPVSNFVISLTDFAVKPLRRIVPSWRKFDLSTLIAAVIAQSLLYTVLFLTKNLGVGALVIGVIPLLVTIALLKLFLYIVMYSVFLQAILSWVAPHSPVAPVLNAMTRPILSPFRRWIPLLNGIDLSPFVVLILAQMLIILLGSL